MADSAFKVLVLPRGEQADISKFGAELQKICDQVNTAKVKVQADPTAITDSLKAALSSVKLDVQFNASSIETSIKTALTGKTFDINVNPVVQQGNSGGSAGSTGNSGGQQRQPRQQQIGQRDTFAKIVASEAYLEGLRKKLKVAEYKGNDQSAYKAQIETYSKGLSDRKVQFAANNNTTVAELDKVIKQTDRFTKAQAETAAASEKARLAWDAQVAEASDLTKQMDEASTRIKTLQSYEGKDSKNRAGLLTQLVNQPLMNNLVKTITEKNDDKTETKRTGLLPDYETRLTKLKTLVEQIKTPEFKSDTIENQRAKINELNRAYADFNQTEKQVVKEMDDFQNKAGNYKSGFFDEFVEGVSKKFGWAVMAAAAREARQALSQLYTNVVQLDGALTQISIVTGTSGEALKSFANDAANVAKEVGSTTSAIISSTETYARLGYSLQDSLNLADITARYANVAAVDTESATSALTSIMKGFGFDPSEMEGVVDKLVKVGQEYAISAGELGDAMQRGGAALAAGGASFDEALAIMTAGNAATQNADTVGNALKTVSARIRSATAELTEMGEAVDDIVTSTSKYRAEIKALSGVDIMESDGQTYRSVYNILKDIAEVYDSLSDINKAQLLEDLAGKRNAQVVASIITNIDDLTGSYEAAQNAAGTLATANETYLDSIQGKMNQLSTSYEQLSMKLLSNNAIKFVVDALKLLVNVLNSIDTATGGLSTMSLEITALITLLPALFKAFAQSKALATFGDSIKVVSSGILGLASKAIPALSGAATAASASIGAAVASMGAIALVIAAVVAFVKGIRSAIPTLSDKKAELEETKSDIAEIESKLQDVKSCLEELNAIENPTLADQAEIDKLTVENKQLEWQLELKKKLAEQEAVDVEQTALKKYHNDFSDKREVGGNPRTSGVGGFYSEMAYATTYAANAQTAWDKYYAALENDDKNAADQAKASAEKWERLQQHKLTSAGSIYKELGQIIAENGITGATAEGQEVLDMYNEMGLALSKLEGVSIDAGTAVSSVLGEFKYEPLKTVLDQMKEAGTLSAEAIQQMFEEGEKIAETGADLENPNYLLTVLIETLAELLGLDLTSGTEGFQFLADALNGVGEAAGNAADGLNSIDYETVDAAKSKVDAVTAAMKDYKEYNGLTKSSVDKLTSAFPALRDALYDSEGTVRDESKTYYVDTDGTEWNPNGATAWSRDFYEKVHEGSAYGIAAPYLVGTVIAGSNLIIESAKQDSGKAVFRVDADGAKLYNSRFDLAKDLSEGGTNDTGLISLNPGIGFVGGKNTTTAPLFSYDKQGNVNGVVLADGTVKQDLMSLNKDNLPRPNFWIDMLGNAYLKGTIYATDGVFSGELKAATGDFSGTVKASKFVGTMDMSAGDLIGPNIYVPSKSEPKFKVDGKTGKVTITDGSISFSSLDQTTKDNISSANTAATEAKAAAAGAQATADAANGLAGSANIAADNAVKKVNGWAYGGTTYIDGAKIMTGTVMASKLLGGSVGLIAPTTNGEMTVGSMDIVYTNDNTQYGLGITSAYGGIQIVSASNTNIFLSAGSGSAITMSGGKVKLSGALCLGATYGTASPKSQGISGDYGQIYVQYV